MPGDRRAAHVQNTHPVARGFRLDPTRDGVVFARRLITEIGVSCVPAVSFWRPENVEHGRAVVRFAFPNRPQTLHAAIDRLQKLRG